MHWSTSVSICLTLTICTCRLKHVSQLWTGGHWHQMCWQQKDGRKGQGRTPNYTWAVHCISFDTECLLENIVSIGRPGVSGDQLQELKDIIRKKSGPRAQKASSNQHIFLVKCIFDCNNFGIGSLKNLQVSQATWCFTLIPGQSKSFEKKSGEEEKQTPAAEPKDPFVQCLFLGLA